LLKQLTKPLTQAFVFKLAPSDFSINPRFAIANGSAAARGSEPRNQCHFSTLAPDSGAEQGITSDSNDSTFFQMAHPGKALKIVGNLKPAEHVFRGDGGFVI
jgi:hypothetical protein